VVGNAGSAILNAAIFLAAVVPIVGFLFFARWFLRAGKRYDEQERVTGREPPQ
jgi:ABC-type glycerol-3-phosphate transport system permease component